MIKKIAVSLFALAFVLGLAFTPSPAQAEVICTPTGYIRDTINLTAAYINSTSITSPVDATGCNIGVYFDHNYVGTAVLDKVEIYGANYFGVLVNGNAGDVVVNITNSSIHHIGEVPFNGAQHGVAIYYVALEGYKATGKVEGNTISAYQKGGIVVNGAEANVTVIKNTVTGLGPVDFIAQNGIQFGWGATGKITGNEVSGNYYTLGCTGKGMASCTWISAGILLYNVDTSFFVGLALKSTNDLFDNQYDVLRVSAPSVGGY